MPVADTSVFDVALLSILVFGIPLATAGIGVLFFRRGRRPVYRAVGLVVGALGAVQLVLEVRFFADFCYGDEPRRCGDWYFDLVYYGWWVCVGLVAVMALISTAVVLRDRARTTVSSQ